MTTFSHDGATGVTRLPAASGAAPTAPDSPHTAPDTAPTAPDTAPTAAAGRVFHAIDESHVLMGGITGSGKSATLRHLVDVFTAAGWSSTASDGKASTAGDGGRSA